MSFEGHFVARSCQSSVVAVLAVPLGWLLAGCLLALPMELRADPRAGHLHAAIGPALQEEGLEGAVWATLHSDGRTEVGAAGARDSRSGAPMTADTRVQVGSVAKTVLAAGVMHLITEGRLTLDTPVSELLPSLTIDNPWHSRGPVRVRHLLSHTSGLDNARLWQVFSLVPDADVPLHEVFARDPALLRVQTSPGSRFAYSNMGYVLLGMIIERITGERYETWLDRELLQKLSMRDSTFRFVSQEGKAGDPRLAMGHFEDGVTQVAVPLYLRAAGQFTTTAADMARFARFLLGDGSVAGATFIDPALLAAMAEPTGTEAAIAGLSIGHGLALARRDRHGVIAWCHPGVTIGFNAMFCLFPDAGKAFFIAINTDSEVADYNRFNAILTRHLDIPGASVVPAAPPMADIGNWEGLYVPTPNAMSTFAWIDVVLNFVRVRRDGRHLVVKPFQSAASRLTPVGGRLFRADERTEASHVLLISDEGRRVVSHGLRSYQQVPAASIALHWASMTMGLLGITYVLVAGLWRAGRRRLKPTSPIFVPFLSVVALALPVPLFFLQPFLRLGDVTAASVSLALVTAALPLAMIAGLFVQFRQRSTDATAVADPVAFVAILQWTLVLVAWGIVPFRLWA